MPLGEGYAIEAGHGLAERGGLRLVAFEPRPGRFPDEPPPAPPGPHAVCGTAGGRAARDGPRRRRADAAEDLPRPARPRRLGPGAAAARRRSCSSTAQDFAALTGRAPPPTPIDAATYARAGLPWFDLYDEAAGTVGPAGGAPPRTVRDRDRERGT